MNFASRIPTYTPAKNIIMASPEVFSKETDGFANNSRMIGMNATTMDRKIPTTLWKTQLLKLVSEAPKALLVECDEMSYQRFPSNSAAASSSGDDSDQSIQSLGSVAGGDLNLGEREDIRRNHHHHHNHHHRHSLRRHGILQDDDEVIVTTASNDLASSISVNEIGLDFQRCLRLSIKNPQHHHLMESSSNCSNSLESSHNSHSPSPPQPIIMDDDDVNNDSPNGSLSRCHSSRSNNIHHNEDRDDELVIPPLPPSTSSASAAASITTTSAPPWDRPDLYLYNPFGSAFHGYLSHSQTKQRLTKDGHYLVRKRVANDDFVLSVRFNGRIKHFIIVFDDTSGLIYVGDRDKGYEKLQDLVQSGLITLYLDQKAGPYIDLMCDLTQFNNQRNQHVSNLHNGSSHDHQNRLRHHSPSSPNSHSTALITTPNSSINTNNLISSTISSLNGRLNNFKLSSNSSSSVSKNHQHQQHSPSPSVSSLSRSSMERQRIPDLRAHSFQVHTFQELSRCQICQNFLWGLSSQGLLCKDCNLITHENCAERVITDCEPQLSHIAQVFGADLTILVKAAGGFRPPFVIEKCVTEIETRGLHIEGIYRVSGSKEQTERLKKYLEQERESADMSQFPDIHSMCGLVKFYFRILPQPLITTDVFQRFLNAGELDLEIIKRDLKKLPGAHYVTLRYLLRHLHQVAQRSDRNKMNPFNLSSVFAPSLLCPAQLNMSTLKAGTTALEMMIINVPILFPKI